MGRPGRRRPAGPPPGTVSCSVTGARCSHPLPKLRGTRAHSSPAAAAAPPTAPAGWAGTQACPPGLGTDRARRAVGARASPPRPSGQRLTTAPSPGLGARPAGMQPGARPPEREPRCEPGQSPARPLPPSLRRPTPRLSARWLCGHMLCSRVQELRGHWPRQGPPGCPPGPPHLRPVVLLHRKGEPHSKLCSHRRGGPARVPHASPLQHPLTPHTHRHPTRPPRGSCSCTTSTHPAHTTHIHHTHAHAQGMHSAPRTAGPAKRSPAELRPEGTQTPPQNSTHHQQGLHQRGLHQQGLHQWGLHQWGLHQPGVQGPSSGQQGAGTGRQQAAGGRWD